MRGLLEFNKERSIGQTISFAFMIFRKNVKNFWIGMLVAVFPWLAGAAICITPFIIQWANGNTFNWDSFIWLLLFAIVFYMFGFLVLNTYVNEYVIAVRNDTIDQKPHYKHIVKATFRAIPKNIGNFFLLSILWMLMSAVVMGVVYIFMLIMFFGILTGSVIIMGLGYVIYMLAYFISFAYLSICTGPIIFISQYEKVGFFKALEINFSYVHARKGFWAGILISLFGFILMYVISINITEPVAIVVGAVKYSTGTLDTSENQIMIMIAMIYLTVAVTWPLSSFIMMMIFGANYFNQKERALGPGLMERIDKIGEQKDYDSSKLEADF